MTDRELLELAAKAAGLQVVLWPISDGRVAGWELVDGKPNASRPWCPLDDDGDALRLAVKLRLCVDNCIGEIGDRNDVTVGEEAGAGVFVDEGRGSDPYAATRRAIVRAAAELGKAMP